MGQRLTNDLRLSIRPLDLPRRPRGHLIPVEQPAGNETLHGSRADPTIPSRLLGLDHGVGHSLLLLYDVKAPNGQKSSEFKGLGHYPSDASLSTF